MEFLISRREVIGGTYGFQEPQGDPDAFIAYMAARHEGVAIVHQYWDFIRVRVRG